MPNPNYIAGRAFEYKRMAVWEEKGYLVLRSAGSHGPFDLVAVKQQEPINLLQLKRVESVADAERLLKAFKAKPPLGPSRFYHQVIEVWVKRVGLHSVAV